MLSGAGRGSKGRAAAATTPAPVATRIVSKNLFRPDLIAAFQLACRKAPSRTARTASLGIGPGICKGRDRPAGKAVPACVGTGGARKVGLAPSRRIRAMVLAIPPPDGER